MQFSRPGGRVGVRFPGTQWSLVTQAGDRVVEALQGLGVLYREPLIAYLLAAGYSTHDAEDAVQSLMVRFMDPGFLANVAPAKGRFRSWLLTTLKHQVANAEARQRAAKRGGGIVPEVLDTLRGEHAPGKAVADRRRSPDQEYEYRWAQKVLANAWRSVRSELAAQGREHWIAVLEPVLYRDGDRAPYRQIAETLDLTESGARSAAQRLRDSLRQAIRDEIARTIPDPDQNPGEVEAELNHLVRILMG